MRRNIAGVRIRNTHLQAAFYHKQMATARVGAAKSKCVEFLRQLSPRNIFRHVLPIRVCQS